MGKIKKNKKLNDGYTKLTFLKIYRYDYKSDERSEMMSEVFPDEKSLAMPSISPTSYPPSLATHKDFLFAGLTARIPQPFWYTFLCIFSLAGFSLLRHFI
jgi:hypothetical protein